MTKQQISKMGVFACWLAVVGCEQQTAQPFVPPVVPPSAGARAAGSGGRGGSGGMPAPAMPAPCGSVTCQLSTVMIPNLMSRPPCCLDMARGTCGWLDRDSTTCVPPPPLEAKCPATATGLQKGCCAMDRGRCGIDASMFLSGCFVLDGTMFADPANNPPQNCDGTLVPAGGAGGMGGGGGAGGGGGGGGAGGAAGGSGGAGGSRGGAGGSSGAGAGRGGAGGGSAGTGRGGTGGGGG